MNLSYIISGYKNFDQIRRLIGRLDDPHSRFVLLIDGHSPGDAFESFRQTMADNPRVEFLPRMKMRWGDFSLTANCQKAVGHLLKSDFKFDYVFCVTGQDYPLQSPDEIRQTLAAAKGRSFVLHEAFPVARWEPGGMGRLFSYNFVFNRKAYQFPKWNQPNRPWVRWAYRVINLLVPKRGPFPLNLHPFGGSLHWTLSREAAEYVEQFVRANPAYDRRFRFTFASDEVYVQTILANSPLRDRLIDNDLRFLKWPAEGAASPAVLTQADLPQILACDAVFARKFDVTVDARVLDLIDEAVDSRQPRRASNPFRLPLPYAGKSRSVA
jgi:hypothetical protein